MPLKLTIAHVTCQESHKHHTKIAQVLRKCWAQHTQLWHSLTWQQQPRLTCAGSLQVVSGLLWNESAGYEMELPFCLPGPHFLTKKKSVWLRHKSKAEVRCLQQWWDERKTLMGVGGAPNLVHSLNSLFFQEMPMHLSHLETLQSLSKGLQTIS